MAGMVGGLSSLGVSAGCIRDLYPRPLGNGCEDGVVARARSAGQRKFDVDWVRGQ